MANLELRKHGGAHATRGGHAEKTEASFVVLDHATGDKVTQKSKRTKSFRLLKSSKTCSTSKLTLAAALGALFTMTFVCVTAITLPIGC